VTPAGKRNALGRGLAALLPEVPDEARPRWAEVAIEEIDPNPLQPRQRIEAAKLQELAASLARQGVMQPLLVRRVGDRYQLIAGERRWRAARAAGLARVPVIVREAKDGELLELALIENLQREDLNPMEEASAYRRLMTEFGLSQEQIAERVGKDRTTVANFVRLLKLPAPVREALAREELSPGHARPLLGLPSAEAQVRIARQVVAEGLSVREVERRVRLETETPAGTSKKAKLARTDPNTRAAEDRLRTALGTRVRILRRGQGGSVEVAFYSEEELQRIYEILLRGSRAARSG
jgi:ParB family chromosome partitioning protein